MNVLDVIIEKLTSINLKEFEKVEEIIFLIDRTFFEYITEFDIF